MVFISEDIIDDTIDNILKEKANFVKSEINSFLTNLPDGWTLAFAEYKDKKYIIIGLIKNLSLMLLKINIWEEEGMFNIDWDDLDED